MTQQELTSKHKDIQISKHAINFLKSQSKKTRELVFEKIDYALKNSRSLIPMHGNPKRHKIRINNIRVLIELRKNPRIVFIADIDYRGNIYKRI